MIEGRRKVPKLELSDCRQEQQCLQHRIGHRIVKAMASSHRFNLAADRWMEQQLVDDHSISEEVLKERSHLELHYL